MLAVADAELFVGRGAEAAALAAEGFLVGCIVAAEHEARRGARRSPPQGVEFGTPERDGILKPVTRAPAQTAKGLEFDAVVVVEPAAIVGGRRAGLRLLYVALTRPIQHLTVRARACRCRTRSSASAGPLRR